MTVSGYDFKPKLWSIIVTLASVILFTQLGNWQLSRAKEKDDKKLALEQLSKEPAVSVPGVAVKLDDYRYRKVVIQGQFKPEHTIYLDNKVHNRVAGYHVLTPIRLANSDMHVLVNRGWIATGNDRSLLPPVSTLDGEVDILGIVESPAPKTLELSDQIVKGDVWGNLHLTQYQEKTGLKLQPILVLQENDTGDGLIRQWSLSKSNSDKNIGYAVQWFSLAVTTVIIFLILNVKRNNSENKSA